MRSRLKNIIENINFNPAHPTVKRAAFRSRLRSGTLGAAFFFGIIIISLFFKTIPIAGAAGILLLNSYHQGHKWTDDINQGVYSILSHGPEFHTLYTEQMDAGRFKKKEDRDNLTQWLAAKYRHISIDAVIVSDGIALGYLLMVKNRLFPEIPVIFCGTNGYPKKDLTAIEKVTDVTETPDLQRNITLIAALHPDTRRIVVITDTFADSLELNQSLSNDPGAALSRIAVVCWKGLSHQQLINRIDRLSAGDIVLYLTFYGQEGDRAEQNIQTLYLLSKGCRVPIYSVWDGYLGHGIVGGYLLNGFEQGRAAGRRVLKILSGQVTDRPELRQDTHRYMFDYRQMRRFSIDPERLPEDSTIIYQPQSIFTQHRIIVTIVLGGVIGLHFIIFSLILNVLKRRRAETDILKNQRRFNTIIETAKEGFVEIDPHMTVLQVNPEMCAMIGRSRKAIVGSLITNYMTTASASKLKRHLKGTLSGSRCSFEITITRQNQNKIYCLFNMSPIMDETQSGIGCFAMVSDVTELKLLESQLLQAQKMEAIGNLAGGIAHDFNNRLQTISGYTQLLLHDKNRSEPEMEKLAAIQRSVRSSCELIDQLLMFSRKIESRLTPTDLNREVRQIRKILQRTIPRMIGIQLKLSSDIGIINANPPQIEQIIMNLSINASHAMPTGGTLTIATANVTLDEKFCKQNIEAMPGNFVRLRIKDNGIGMTKEILEHIFEPFFSTKSPGKGTGLGLAMVHGIIKNHNGFITCRSIPDQGACFDLYFPMIPIDPNTLTLHVAPELEMVGGRETILLVEDDMENLDVEKSMLERFGYTVLTAKNYDEALAVFRKDSNMIDLTILDLNLPGAGGHSILKEIIAMTPSTKVLISSGFSGLAVKHALAAGASGYIRKPYQMADLLGQVRAIIDRKSS